MNNRWLIVLCGIGVVLVWSRISIVALDKSTKIKERDVEEMVLIPEGYFIIGADEEDGLVGIDVGVDELPKRRIYLDAFYIDKYEVTNQQYKRFVDDTGHRVPFYEEISDTPNKFYNWNNGTFPEGRENFPVVLVDWYDADAYCKWAGKRLPTEEEWEKAARGTDGRIWPWGDRYDRFKCNTKDSGIYLLTEVGSFPGGASPYGVMDMCGNVFEWTSSWYKAYPGNDLKRKAFGEKYKVTKGGAFSYWALPYARPSARFVSQPLDLKHRSYGFRCAKSKE